MKLGTRLEFGWSDTVWKLHCLSVNKNVKRVLSIIVLMLSAYFLVCAYVFWQPKYLPAILMMAIYGLWIGLANRPLLTVEVSEYDDLYYDEGDIDFDTEYDGLLDPYAQETYRLHELADRSIGGWL